MKRKYNKVSKTKLIESFNDKGGTPYGLRSKGPKTGLLHLMGKKKAGLASKDPGPQPWDFIGRKVISKYTLRKIDRVKQRLKVKALAELYKRRYVKMKKELMMKNGIKHLNKQYSRDRLRRAFIRKFIQQD
jgi:hypothetical protein